VTSKDDEFQDREERRAIIAAKGQRKPARSVIRRQKDGTYMEDKREVTVKIDGKPL